MRETISNLGLEKTRSDRPELRLILGGQLDNEARDASSRRETNFSAQRLRTLAQQKFPNVINSYERNLIGSQEIKRTSAEALLLEKVWLPLARKLDALIASGITREEAFASVLAKAESGEAFLDLIADVRNLRNQEIRPALQEVV